MVPSMMEELLFDDILFGERARQEHRQLQQILALVADDVLLFDQLLTQALSDTDRREQILSALSSQLNLQKETQDQLKRSSDPAVLAHQLIEGVLQPETKQVPEQSERFYALPPLPNMMFHRDPAAVVGHGVIIGSMATPARLREQVLVSAVFKQNASTEDEGTKLWFEAFDPNFRRRRSTAHPRPSIEGGDILVPREDLLLIGHSIRTSRQTIAQLAAELRQAKSPIRHILVVELPPSRRYMHLDTVFTIINQSQCLVHEPVILEGQVEQAAVYQIDLDGNDMAYRSKASLLSALKQLAMDLEPISCGGADDPIAQEREQWTDGANAFALAPGVILLYARNIRTAAALDQAGFTVVDAATVLNNTDAWKSRLAGGPEKIAVLLEGYELSRARGGPRCLTMPLQRDIL